MTESEKQQILSIIKNLEEKKTYIPYLCELEAHEVFGPIFKSLSVKEKEEIKKMIDEYIVEKLESLKTKWWVLFKRFYEVDPDMFWKFRDLNEKDENIENPEFHKIGKIVEQEMFKLEWILTERMFKQEKWLDKVVWSFYNIVYSFFPRYGRIE